MSVDPSPMHRVMFLERKKYTIHCSNVFFLHLHNFLYMLT